MTARVTDAAQALLDDVRRRYPGEEFRCEYMRALDEAIEAEKPNSAFEAAGWMETFTGKQFFPMTPREADLDMEDIAHALAMSCRYGGHQRRFYSVAEHCVLLMDHAYEKITLNPGALLHVLLHDASEAYLSDVIRPIKPFLPEYKRAEARLQRLILDWAGLSMTPVPKWLPTIDASICCDERAQNMADSGLDWGLMAGLHPLGVELKFWSPEVAKHEFLQRWIDMRREHTKDWCNVPNAGN